MKIQFKIVSTLFITLFLAACSSQSSTERSIYETSLYDGKAIDSLTEDDAPLTESEAIKRGDQALQQGDLDLALYEYIRSISYPDAKYQDRTLMNIGFIHEMRGTEQLAERAYLMSLDFNPDGIQPLEKLGSMYMEKGLLKEGKSYFYRSLNADQIRLNGTNFIKASDSVYPEDIQGLLIDESSPALAYMGLGILSDLDGDHKLAEQMYEKALVIKPNSIKVLVNSGYSYYMNGNYVDAKRYTMWALERAPNNEKALNNLALIYLAEGNIKRAINVFMRHMDTAEALNNIGYFLILQGRPEEAIPYLEQAIDKKPSYYRVANENLNRAIAEMRVLEERSTMTLDEPIIIQNKSPVMLYKDIGDEPKVIDIVQ